MIVHLCIIKVCANAVAACMIIGLHLLSKLGTASHTKMVCYFGAHEQESDTGRKGERGNCIVLQLAYITLSKYMCHFCSIIAMI